MKTSKRLATMATALLLLLSMAAMASAGVDCSNRERFGDHPQCQDPYPATTTTTTAPLTASTCAADGNEQYATDGIVEFPAGGSDNWCDDIRNEDNGTEIRFDFSVAPPDKVLRAGFVLGIRNGIPGDWCGGFWSLYDASGAPVFENALGNAINPGTVGDGWYATLVVDEQFAPDGNCTADGDLLWYDNDPNWVLTIGGGAGKPLKGDEAITVTWTPWNPPTP